LVLVVVSLAGALRPGGYLLVGVSESLLRFGTSLSCEERRGEFLYRKAMAPLDLGQAAAAPRGTAVLRSGVKPRLPWGST
jgi:hypothetical protein